MTKLSKGVNLHVIPTKKFKTISIKLKFKNKLDKETITKRSLISRLIETNSQFYPTQTDFQKALSELYGASFESGVSKKGLLHIVSFGMNFVNDKFLSESDVLEKAIQFLHSVLYYPNAYNGAFQEETFNREVDNLRDDFESVYDNKGQYAILALKKLYFNDEEQQIPAEGRIEDLNYLNPENVYQAYEDMIFKDEVDIYVLGDVNEKEIIQLFKNFEFSERNLLDSKLFYSNEDSTPKENTEIQPVTQAKLNIAYDTDIYYHTKNYFAGQVFNGLFGGFPHSKLFVNVREKESLAYYASSNLDTFRGVMYVQTGIDKKEAQKVLDIVDKQLNEMKQGQFSDEDLEQTKAMIKNGLLQSEDNSNSIIERNFALRLVDKDLSIEKWNKKIDEVSKEDVIEAAKSVNLRATFLLRGEGVDGTEAL